MTPDERAPAGAGDATSGEHTASGVRTALRAHAEDAVGAALVRARQGSHALALLVVDLDGIGEVEQALGYETAAALLGQLQERLLAAAPAGTILLPFVGDRLVALCERIGDAAAAATLADGLASAANRPLAAGDADVRLPAHVGVAVAPGGRGEAASLLRDADAAARQARTGERRAWSVAGPAVHERATRRLRLEDELARGLRHGELALHFQPVVSLRGGEVQAVEALLRWSHPRRGVVEAAEFVPVAERSDLILELDAWVLREATDRLLDWVAREPGRTLPPIALNVSARELRMGAIARRIAGALAEGGIAPRAVAVELAGPLAATAGGWFEDALAALRRIGVRTVLDRFAADARSLARLPALAVDEVKLDRAFVQALATQPGSDGIVQALVELAHALGVTITAAGVETAEQLAALRALSVDAAQGHLLGRPGVLPPHLLPEDARAATATDGEELVTLSAAAAALGVSSSTVRRLADHGVLPGRRTEGGHRRFRRADVQRVARARGRIGMLKPLALPVGPLPRVASALARHGIAFVRGTARAIYDPRGPGWFASPAGEARARSWLDAIAAAMATGEPQDGVGATVALLEAAALAGATAAECLRFAGQFATVAGAELARAGTSAEEVRALQRLLGAAAEGFVERVGRRPGAGLAD